MITKINNFSPCAYNIKSQNKPQMPCSIPSFSGVSDSFIGTIAKEKIPVPVKEALAKALAEMETKGFEKFEQAILNEDEHVVLKNLVLKAIKVDENQINVKVAYANPATDGTGFLPIATGSPNDVIKSVQSEGFLGMLLSKVRERSNYLFFHDETKRLNDFND